MTSFFRKLFAPFVIITAWITIIFSFFAYLSPYISPNFLPFIPFFGLFYPIIFVIQLLSLPFLFQFKKKVFVYMLLTILAGYGHFSGNLQLSRNADKRLTNNSFTLMSYNMGASGVKEKISAQDLLNRKVEVVNHARPNILCLQEMQAQNFDYPYKVIEKPYRVAFFSDFPIRKYKFFGATSKKATNIVMYADVVLDERVIRVFNLHLQSNVLGKDADDFVENLDKINETESKKSYLRTIRKLRHAWQVRAIQAAVVADSIAASPYPVIVCGDMNDTPSSYSYRTVSYGLRDAFKHGGRGFSFSYNRGLPALSIDHIFVAKNYPIYGFRVVRQVASDHYPIRVEIGY